MGVSYASMKWIGIACIILLFVAGLGAQLSSSEPHSELYAYRAKTGFSISPETGTIEQITQHFIIDYRNAWPLVDTKCVGEDVMEPCYDHINGYFHALPEKISVEIIGQKTMVEIVEAEAFSLNNVDKIVFQDASLKNLKKFKGEINHELTHQAINNIFTEKNGKEYMWMHEGLAQIMGNDPCVPDLQGVIFIKKYGFIDLGDIYQEFHADTDNEIGNAYYQSYSLCKFILDRYGMDSLIDIVKSPEPRFTRGFEKVTGDDFETVYADWQRSITDESQ